LIAATCALVLVVSVAASQGAVVAGVVNAFLAAITAGLSVEEAVLR
jgi:hypothetical protein